MATLRSRKRTWGTIVPTAGLCLASLLAPLTALADTDLTIGGAAVVSYANGDSVRVRTEPSINGAVVAEVAEGTTVTVTDGIFWAEDGSAWYQVDVNGMPGFMVADYLSLNGGGVGGPSGNAVATEQVYVRTGPSTADSILASLEGGDGVTLTGNSANGFYEIYYGDYVGYVYADYISTDGSAPAPAAAETQAAPAVQSGTSYTNDSVNLRAGASTGDAVVAVLPAGTEVTLTGNVSGGFAEASTGSGAGWISQDYLGGTPPAQEPVAASGGQAMVDFAMQFVGYPYVWAGADPSGFDCSGFTMYVAANVLGIDIPHGTAAQASYGAPVAWGTWQPGDFIYFADTGDAGISHVGIYIGGGQMVHAENEGTGVVISDVYSDYYASHYYSATRLY